LSFPSPTIPGVEGVEVRDARGRLAFQRPPRLTLADAKRSRIGGWLLWTSPDGTLSVLEDQQGCGTWWVQCQGAAARLIGSAPEGEIVQAARFSARRSQFGRTIVRPGLVMARGGRRR
jgi:hypothetical protein